MLTKKRLKVALWQAAKIFRTQEVAARYVFERFFKQNYARGAKAKFDTFGTMKRLKCATLQHGRDFDESTLAYNDSERIVMLERTMHDSEIVQILIHKALHNWCIVRGKFMGCDREHA